MKRRLRAARLSLQMKALLVLAAAAPLLGQSWYPRHNFSFGVGRSEPRADLAGPFGSSPEISVGYGYRFRRYLQADLGLDVVFHAARVRDFLVTGFGDLPIHDYQFLIPFGVRAVLPLQHGRFLLSGGGGGAFLRYTELVSQPSYFFQIDCPVCTSRDGWGFYGLAAADVALDQGQHFRFGVASRFYHGYTNGDPLGALPGVRTTDRWVTVFAQFGFSF